ncbi:MAG TPA: sulfatase-like hydrolase/transferase [Actinoplanes sp.]|nr:sulfatase-like hydrolase/transferase [Actinoplanes sp.]
MLCVPHDVQPTDLADPQQNPDSGKPPASETPAPAPSADSSTPSPTTEESTPPADSADADAAETKPEPAEAEPSSEASPEASSDTSPDASPDASPEVEKAAPEAVSEAEEAKPAEPEVTEAVAAAPAGDTKTPGRVRRFLSSPWTARSLNVLAFVMLFGALLYPNVLRRITFGSFARIPIEAAVLILLLVVLPRRPRIAVGSITGAILGWLLIQKSLDMGWFKTLARPFDVVLDWELFDDTYSFIRDSYGQIGAYAAAAGVVLGGLAAIAAMIWAVLRAADVMARHRRPAALTATGIAAVWMVALALGVQLVPGVPIAARTTATYAWDRVVSARAGIANEAAFAGEVAQDPFKNTPPDQLLSALKGKDVIFAFVESYGRNAVESPEFVEGTGAVLAEGDAKLTQAGFAARSGWLTSPTFGGNSWLAHSTLLSGLWINNQSRYRNLTASDRLTVTSAFKKAEWDTVSVMPGATRAWPEGKFYGYNRVWDSRNLGYQGPKFSWAQMPDQYTLKKFTELEYAKPNRDNLFVEIPLISSHTPWAPIPSFFPDWNQVGDGSIYSEIADMGEQKADVWASTESVRTEYGRSIQYTLTTLIDWVQKYGNDDLVLVYLGDHQPSSVVSGDNASHDVPITLIAKDPKVLEKIDSWGWAEGLKPQATSPVWQMSQFRDKFLTAYGPGEH